MDAAKIVSTDRSAGVKRLIQISKNKAAFAKNGVTYVCSLELFVQRTQKNYPSDNVGGKSDLVLRLKKEVDPAAFFVLS